MNGYLKQIAFWAVLLLVIPFILFAAVEGYLRYSGYGFESELFVAKEVRGQEMYFLNPYLKEKYQFTGRFTEFNPITAVRMKREKAPGDFRVFCLGGSTTQGYPYASNGSFPSFLEGMLNLAQSRKNVEVVNLGVTAMNSHGVLDFMRMVPEYEPDLILVYMGHNEFFGALGSASNLFFSDNRHIIKAYLRLQELKTYLLLRDLINRLRASMREEKPLTTTLMKEIVRVKSIPVESPLRETTYENFRGNLREILSIARENRIPVVVATVVSNLKDFKPFDYEKSPPENNAQLFFDRGRSYLAEGRRDEALRAFIAAKDKDTIPFRAPSEINQGIREVAGEMEVQVLDLEKTMNLQAGDGVLGKPEFIEHLHPTFIGNYIIAANFARVVFGGMHLRAEKSVNYLDPRTVELVKERAGFTGVDVLIAEQRIRPLVGEWPFNVNNADYIPPRIDPGLGELPHMTISAKKGEVDAMVTAHMKVGAAYMKSGEYLRAYREFNAAAKIDVFSTRARVERERALRYLKAGKVSRPGKTN